MLLHVFKNTAKLVIVLGLISSGAIASTEMSLCELISKAGQEIVTIAFDQEKDFAVIIT